MDEKPAQDESQKKPGANVDIDLNIGQNLGMVEGLHIDQADQVNVVLPPLPQPSFGGAIPTSRVEDYLPRGEIENQARRRLLRKEAAAIVGVHAPGGLGKTELAIRLAKALKGQFDGVLWVEMKGKTPEQVVGDLARQCGLRFPPGIEYGGMLTELRRILNERPALVVLDNVQPEQTAHLADFLPPSPPCAALITSRVQNFAALPAKAMLPLAPLDEAQALQLLSGVVGEELVNAEREAAKALAKRCCYNPLALDIAARLLEQTQHLNEPVATLERKLRDRQAALKSGDDPRLDLQAVFDESYEALSADDRRRYRRLAAFHSSGFSPLGAAALWGDEAAEANDAIQRLANRSLLAPAAGRGERWRLHDLLDEHAAEHLVEEGEAEDAHRTAAVFLLKLFDEHSQDDLSNAPEVGDELDNLRHAAAWAIVVQDGELLARLSTVPDNWLATIFSVEDERFDWMQSALNFGIDDQMLAADVLSAMGDTLQFRNDIDGAMVKYKQAMELYETVGDLWGQANVHYAQGNMFLYLKDIDVALAEYAQALALYEDDESLLGQANVLMGRADALWFRDDYNGALAEYTRALGLYDVLGDRLGQANVMKARGDVLKFRDDYDGALSEYNRALTLFESMGTRQGQAYVLMERGDVMKFRKDYGGALAEFEKAQTLFDALGNQLGRANVLKARADVLGLCMDMDGAQAEYVNALELFEAVGSRLGQANTLTGIGRLHLARGEQAEADALLVKAIEIFKSIGDRYSIAYQTGSYGRALYDLDRKELARPYLLRAAELFEAMGLQDYADRHRRAASE